jgi:hypothetical protein
MRSTRGAIAVACRIARARVLGACALWSWGCGAADYGVPSYPQPEGSPAEVVAFPPPPAQIEHLNAKPPAQGCLWADGQWVWATQHWNWRPGGWVRPPEGCQYSPPTVQWAASGQTSVLYYRPGRWYSTEETAGDDTAGGEDASDEDTVVQNKPCPDPVSCPAPDPVRSSPVRSSPAPTEGAPRS